MLAKKENAYNYSATFLFLFFQDRNNCVDSRATFDESEKVLLLRVRQGWSVHAKRPLLPGKKGLNFKAVQIKA